MAKIIFSNLTAKKEAVVRPDTLRILESAADKAGIERIYITSTIRTPREQAEAMYKNISSGRLITYKRPGKKVTQLCLDMLGKLAPTTDTIEAMTNLISELSENGERVSLHCVSEEVYATHQILDISRSIIYDKAVKFIKALAEDERVVRIIQPITSSALNNIEGVSFDADEPAIHIEIELNEENV